MEDIDIWHRDWTIKATTIHRTSVFLNVKINTLLFIRYSDNYKSVTI